MKRPIVRLLVLGLLLSPTSASETVVTFAAGAEGWVGPSGGGGATTIDPAGGNPAETMHTVFNDFGVTFRNGTNAAFVGDYTATASVTLSIDLKVDAIEFFGSPVPRPWLLELRDHDDPEPGYPYTSVWFKFADVSSATHGSWTTFEVTIDDTAATDLPPGWGGTGDETGLGEPILPADRSFTDVLAGVDEIAYTTLEPGFFFGFTDHDMSIDNVRVSTPDVAVPALPVAARVALLLLLAAAAVPRLVRRTA